MRSVESNDFLSFFLAICTYVFFLRITVNGFFYDVQNYLNENGTWKCEDDCKQEIATILYSPLHFWCQWISKASNPLHTSSAGSSRCHSWSNGRSFAPEIKGANILNYAHYKMDIINFCVTKTLKLLLVWHTDANLNIGDMKKKSRVLIS